jgi:hypothetical protein
MVPFIFIPEESGALSWHFPTLSSLAYNCSDDASSVNAPFGQSPNGRTGQLSIVGLLPEEVEGCGLRGRSFVDTGGELLTVVSSTGRSRRCQTELDRPLGLYKYEEQKSITCNKNLKMAEIAIPDTNNPSTLPSTTEHGIGATLGLSNGTTNGHGPGYDGLASANGHANGNSKRPVTIAVVGAGQRGQVSHYHQTQLKPR